MISMTRSNPLRSFAAASQRWSLPIVPKVIYETVRAYQSGDHAALESHHRTWSERLYFTNAAQYAKVSGSSRHPMPCPNNGAANDGGILEIQSRGHITGKPVPTNVRSHGLSMLSSIGKNGTRIVKKKDIIGAALKDLLAREESLAAESVDVRAYKRQVIATVEKKLADIQPNLDIPTCDDFAHFGVECCRSAISIILSGS